jgi:glycosyltransferase involved in cell wall biosynthesis
MQTNDEIETASKSLQEGMPQRQDMTVTHLTTVHQPTDPRIVHKQLRTLHEAGYETHLIAPGGQTEPVSGVRMHALPPIRGRYRRVLLHRPAYQTACKIGADCYHIHDPELIPLAYALKRTTGACILYDMHEDYRWHGPVEGRLIRMLERWGFQWIDHVVLAEESYASVVATADVASTFIGNYVQPYDDGLPPHRTELAAPMRLLYTGVVAERRGLLHMIDVVEQSRAADLPAELDVVGVCHHADQRQRADELIAQYGLGRYIRRVGWSSYVPASTMEPYYQAADVGLALFDPAPNYVRSMPTKFFEYVHFGLPILCSDFPLWRQFVERHDCGAVVPPGDIEAALTVLRRWYTEPDRYRALSEAARTAAAQYQWDIMGERLVRLYDRLLGVQATTG